MCRYFILICIWALMPAICLAETAPIWSSTESKGDSVITTFLYNQIGNQTFYPTDELVVEDGTFRVTMKPGNSGYVPNYSKAGCARVKEGGIIIVESLDGREISDITFYMLYGPNVPYNKMVFSAYVDGKMCNSWSGWSSHVTFTTAHDPETETTCTDAEDGLYVYYIPKIFIKRYNGLKMIPAMESLKTSREEPAVAQFSLRVWNDNGVKDFTVTATDATSGKTYGSCTVSRELSEAAPARSGDNTDEKFYTVSGQMDLPGITASTRTKLHLSVSANYDDGRESQTESTPTEVEVKPTISTGVTETTVEDAPCEYYNLQGLRVPHPSGGIYIRRQGSVVTKVRLQ